MIDKCPPEREEFVLDYLDQRFGLKRYLFDGYSLYAGSNGRVFLGPQAVFDLSLGETIGILIARVHKGVKPSSMLFQVFGRHVKRNIVVLDRSQAQSYLRGDDLELSPDEIADATRGYVMLTYLNEPIACGLLKGNRIENVLPKADRLTVEFL